MTNRTGRLAAVALAATLSWALAEPTLLHAQTASDPLAEGFHTPPDSAKPRTWWHWTGGNVTDDGITKDLEWMKRVGIGGYQLADVSAGCCQEVEKKIYFGTPEWYAAVRHAAQEGNRLGLEMSIFSSPGWSEAGGPWVKPDDAMKKLVWSETDVEGPKDIDTKLAEPPSNQGPVLDLNAGVRPGSPPFYRDSLVIAYRTPPDATSMADLHPKATTNNGPIDDAALLDDNLNTAVNIAAPAGGGPAWLQYEFEKPFTARALWLGAHGRIPVGRVLAGDDGVHFHCIAVLPGPQGYHGAAIRTFAFPATTARFFRVEFDGAGLLPAAVIHGGAPIPAAQYTITEAILYSDARVNRWEDKGSFGSLMDRYDVAPTPPAPAAAKIELRSVVDLTSKLDKDGVLHWQAPEGHWTILRLGYSLTGATNHPAIPSATGLEVDKFDAKAVSDYFHGYFDPIHQHLGDLVGSTLKYMTMDSWEAGMQNWTPGMIADFKRLRGYDPTPYLPVLAGHVVESADVSDRFLWDFRRTLADLYASEFYGTMESQLQQLGMGSYAEASGVALEIPEDTLLNKSHIDIPMAEFWVHALHPESMYYVDVRGAVSAAHVYGKPIVATESFTGGGYEAPYTLKKIADYWFAQGVNRLVFHTSAQQPLDTPPGNTMVGTNINRNITWANLAKPLMTYFARVSYMLQQGNPVVDVAYLLPEGAPSTMPFWGSGLPQPPAGYNYDCINTDVLLHRTTVAADGSIHIEGSAAMPAGITYRVLVLPPTQQMTPEVLAKLHQMVKDGATILGPRPTSSPSLADYPEADDEIASMATDLWGDTDGVTDIQHSFGKGMVYTGLPVSEVLTRLNDRPDFGASGSLQSPPAWIHRRTTDTDIYFVVNQSDSPVDLRARLHATGNCVELWRPMDGSIQIVAVTDRVDSPGAHTGALLPDLSRNRQPGIQPAAYIDQTGFTVVPLNLAERESVFVVIRSKACAAPSTVAGRESILATLHGPWTLDFPPHAGAPATVQLPELTSWTASSNSGVKYFSGTATYVKDVNVPAAWFHAGRHLYLDLGKVRDIAEVQVNGTSAGIVWAPPYVVDLTRELKRGQNRLRIEVTNEWTNRIVGDRLLPPDQRVLPQSTTPDARRGPFFGPQEPAESGLVGQITVFARDTDAPARR
ncbi:MAG TPA: glycosyl hydrolase [Candidatus Aquilonibacter sp.]|nr:glycosyl hydrolase [Candidatus Aquilonibacter sp.]